jgi:hypothetical protein
LLGKEKKQQATVAMRWVSWSQTPQPGSTLAVVNGTGMGQLRLIVGIIDNTTLVIESAFDQHLGRDSFIAVVNTYDRKLLAGNTFTFTEVIQFFGVTLGGVIADNSIIDGNVNHSQHTSIPVATKYGGSMRAVGECYHGPAPLFWLEYLGNHFVRSDGIFFQVQFERSFFNLSGHCAVAALLCTPSSSTVSCICALRTTTGLRTTNVVEDRASWGHGSAGLSSEGIRLLESRWPPRHTPIRRRAAQ